MEQINIKKIEKEQKKPAWADISTAQVDLTRCQAGIIQNWTPYPDGLFPIPDGPSSHVRIISTRLGRLPLISAGPDPPASGWAELQHPDGPSSSTRLGRI